MGGKGPIFGERRRLSGRRPLFPESLSLQSDQPQPPFFRSKGCPGYQEGPKFRSCLLSLGIWTRQLRGLESGALGVFFFKGKLLVKGPFTHYITPHLWPYGGFTNQVPGKGTKWSQSKKKKKPSGPYHFSGRLRLSEVTGALATADALRV